MDKRLYQDIKYGTNIIPEEEYLETILTIADVASEMVEKTLGPYGKTTMLNDGTFTYPTKDGWNVLKSLRFNDAIFNTLYGVLRQTSFGLAGKVGDGTTNAFVAAVIFIHKIMDFISENKNVRQSDLLVILKNAVDEINDVLLNSDQVKVIDTDGDFSDIFKIANVSSNGNTDLAEIIQTIYQKTKNPNIYVTLDPSEKLSYEIQTGYKLDCKPIRQNLYVNTEDGDFICSDPMLVFVFDHNVNFQTHDKIITTISKYAGSKNRNAVIFAPYFDDVMMNVMGTQLNRMVQAGTIPNIMLVQVPLANNAQRSYLSDIVMLTNGQVFDYGKVKAFNLIFHKMSSDNSIDQAEDELMKVSDYHFETPQEVLDTCSGMTVRFVAGPKYILLQEYEKIVNPKVYQETLKEVREAYRIEKERADKSSNPLQKDYMDAYQRYTRLLGNLGVIHVGGVSELEKHCLKDSVDDAVLACRSAYDNGYVKGLNISMLITIKKLGKTKEGIEKQIYSMLYDVFREVSVKVIENKYPKADKDYEINVVDPGGVSFGVWQTEIGNDIVDLAVDCNIGFDLVKDQFMSDKSCYVVNSARTDVEVLKGMVSILSTMLTSNQFLSINRAYDRTMGQKQRQEMIRQEKVEDWIAIADKVGDVLIKKYTDMLTADDFVGLP